MFLGRGLGAVGRILFGAAAAPKPAQWETRLEPRRGRIAERLADRQFGQAFAQLLEGRAAHLFHRVPLVQYEAAQSGPVRLRTVHVLVVGQQPRRLVAAVLELLDQHELRRILQPARLDQRLRQHVLRASADRHLQNGVRYVDGYVVHADQKVIRVVPHLGLADARAADGRQPRPAARIVSQSFQQEAPFTLPLRLRLQRTLLRIEDALRGRNLAVLLLPAAGHLLDQHVVVDFLRAKSRFLQRLQNHLLGGALLRDLQYGARLVRHHAVHHQEEHAPLHTRAPGVRLAEAAARLEGAAAGFLRAALTAVVVDALLLGARVNE